MKLAIMQPYFFPYIGYFQSIYAVDKYILYDKVNYIKKGWLNKNRILLVNGEPVSFCVNVKEKSSNKKIFEIEVEENENWQKKNLKVIYFNYKKSPFFEEVYPLIEKILTSGEPLLTRLNAFSIIQVCKYLEIKTPIISDIEEFVELEEKLALDDNKIKELFSCWQLKKFERKVVRVLEICKKENASTYINAFGGQELYDKQEFYKNGINLFFIKTEEIVYPQLSKVFYPNLSIIDVLMNCGKKGTQELLSKYTLI